MTRYKNVFVLFLDPGTMKLVYVLGQSPCDWKTTMHQNAVPITFHAQNTCHHAWTIVKTTFQFIVVIQLRGEGHGNRKNYVTNLLRSFSIFPDLLPPIGKQRYICM